MRFLELGNNLYNIAAIESIESTGPDNCTIRFVSGKQLALGVGVKYLETNITIGKNAVIPVISGGLPTAEQIEAARIACEEQ